MIAIIQTHCLIYPPVFIKPYQCSLMSHTVIQLVWVNLLDKSVFELGYIITHIFKTTQPSRTQFSA